MGNGLHIPTCLSCSSADVLCMRSVYSLRSAGCGGRGSTASCDGVRVVHTGTGEVIAASEGTTAAEVMMEHPNHFLISCSTTADLAPGKRFAPLASHQGLLPNHLYLLLPMHKLRCRLSTHDQTLLSQLSHKLKLLPGSAAPTAPFLLPVSALSFCANRAGRTAPSTLSCMQNAHDVPVGEHTLLSSFIHRTPPPASLWRPSLQTIDETHHLRSWTFREGLVM